MLHYTAVTTTAIGMKLTVPIATAIHPYNEPIATAIGARAPVGPMQCLKSPVMWRAVYKNGQLVGKKTQEPPLMLGPVYLHWDGTYETYHAFFAHLRHKLDNSNICSLKFSMGDLIVSSDEEKALTKAVETCFPQVTTLLCCHNLEENVQRRLQDKVGSSWLRTLPDNSWLTDDYWRFRTLFSTTRDTWWDTEFYAIQSLFAPRSIRFLEQIGQ